MTSFVRRLSFLHGLFPRQRTVHIIGDGRDVTLPALEWVHESGGPGRPKLRWEESVTGSALWWRRRVGPALYREVEYEDLAAHPEARLRNLSGLLGLSFSRRTLAHHEENGA